jgi:hypothetical protein
LTRAAHHATKKTREAGGGTSRDSAAKRVWRDDPLDFADVHPIETVIEEEENEVVSI